MNFSRINRENRTRLQLFGLLIALGHASQPLSHPLHPPPLRESPPLQVPLKARRQASGDRRFFWWVVLNLVLMFRELCKEDWFAKLLGGGRVLVQRLELESVEKLRS